MLEIPDIFWGVERWMLGPSLGMKKVINESTPTPGIPLIKINNGQLITLMWYIFILLFFRI